MTTVAEQTDVSSDERLVRERVAELLATHDPKTTKPKEFWGAQFDLGLAFVHFPEGYGGLGVGPKLQEVVARELRAAGASVLNFARNPIGIGMPAPTVLTHGSEEQKRRSLRPLFTTEEIWCQLFSEPGAGSDVASLSARAVRDGDEWVVNGQKVWTQLTHTPRWRLLPPRPDPVHAQHPRL